MVENPLEQWTYQADSLPGASDLVDLSCLLFRALQGQLAFDSLRHFIADSAMVVRMYLATGKQASPAEAAQVADSAAALLYRQFLETSSQPVVYRTSWAEAHLDKVHLLELPGQRLPTQRIILQATAGSRTLRAGVLCFQLDNRWFLGEGLRFGS